MDRKFWKQFAIALALFLAGYFTFNSKLFAQTVEKPRVSIAVGDSADVVSGAYDHTINLQANGQPIKAFVLQGRAPQIVLAVSNKTMPNYKSDAELKGKKIC